MQMVKHAGKTKMVHLPYAASQLFYDGCPVSWLGGYVVTASSGDSHDVLAGVARETVAATDAKYATGGLLPVEVPLDRFVEWKLAASGAVTLASHRGNEYDLVVTTGVPTVNLSGTTDKILRILNLIGADGTGTTVIVNFKIGGAY